VVTAADVVAAHASIGPPVVDDPAGGPQPGGAEPVATNGATLHPSPPVWGLDDEREDIEPLAAVGRSDHGHGADDPDDDRRGTVSPVEAADRRRRKWPWVLVLLVLVAGAAGGAWWLFLRPISHDLPGLVGRDRAAAVQSLRRLHFDLVVSRQVFDEEQPAGVVLSQTPPPGTSLREGADVRVVVSKGAAPRPVPELTGATEEAARAAIAAAGLTVVDPVSTERNEDVPAGTVISWSPTGIVDKGAPVELVVSAGPPLRLVPKLIGLSSDAARKAIPGGLTVAVAEQFSDSVDKGIVFRVNYAAGVSVPKGTRIVITVSKGPELVAVPDVRGKSPADAERVLKRSGLRVVGITGSPTQAVTRTSPATGAAVRPNSPVTLVTQ
jgi:serine/threonine-protein kinase